MEEVPPFYKAEGCCARHSVSRVKLMMDLPLFFIYICSMWFFKCSCLSHRHVKGRVLVGLSDGTLAIFHRGVGEGIQVSSDKQVKSN